MPCETYAAVDAVAERPVGLNTGEAVHRLEVYGGGSIPRSDDGMPG